MQGLQTIWRDSEDVGEKSVGFRDGEWNIIPFPTGRGHINSLSNPILNPGNCILNHFVTAVFIEYLMEKSSVNLHLLICR